MIALMPFQFTPSVRCSWRQWLLVLCVTGWGLGLNAEPVVYADASDPDDPRISYDEDPYLHFPAVPEHPTVVYSDGTGTATYTDPYTALAPGVKTSDPDTYSLSPASVYYTAPVEPPGPHRTLGVPVRFDFGSGPVEPGYVPVRKSTAYGPATGYGWGDTGRVDERDRGGASSLERDFCLVSGTPFYVDIPNGNYRVSVIVGDAIGKSGLALRAEGLLQLYNIGAAAGKYAYDSFPIKVTDGRLMFEFFGSICHINAISIAPIPDEEWNRPTVFLAGDSTVASYYPGSYLMGWGQPLQQHFTNGVVIDNQAKAGRSSKSFIEEGSLATILNRIKPGDYLFVMFAINDSADDNSNRKTRCESTFKAYMRQYVSAARSRGAVPVFVTSQIKCTYDAWGRFFNSVQCYPDAQRQLGAELNVPVLDLNKASIDYLTAIGVPAARACYATNPSTGAFDYIHLSESGAGQLAALMARLIVEGDLQPLAQHVVKEPRPPSEVAPRTEY